MQKTNENEEKKKVNIIASGHVHLESHGIGNVTFYNKRTAYILFSVSILTLIFAVDAAGKIIEFAVIWRSEKSVTIRTIWVLCIAECSYKSN